MKPLDSITGYYDPRSPQRGARIEVVIEVGRGGLVRRDQAGNLDFISLLPCPFNYGHAPGYPSGDGDDLDAVVLGPAESAGATLSTRVWGVVRFVDAGQSDDKLVCSDAPPTPAQLQVVRSFFAAYATFKLLLNRIRRRRGTTRASPMELFE